MDTLTDAYLAHRPASRTSTLPAWDLRTALRACEYPLETLPLAAAKITSMRAAYPEFAAAAMDKL